MIFKLTDIYYINILSLPINLHDVFINHFIFVQNIHHYGMYTSNYYYLTKKSSKILRKNSINSSPAHHNSNILWTPSSILYINFHFSFKFIISFMSSIVKMKWLKMLCIFVFAQSRSILFGVMFFTPIC